MLTHYHILDIGSLEAIRAWVMDPGHKAQLAESHRGETVTYTVSLLQSSGTFDWRDEFLGLFSDSVELIVEPE